MKTIGKIVVYSTIIAMGLMVIYDVIKNGSNL